MACISYENVGIGGISACVPRGISRNSELSAILSQEQLTKTIDSIGIKEKRVADADTCSSDLCAIAAERLLDATGVDRGDIDLLIFLSQTPDYHIPATAPSLQHRLGLSKKTASFDMNLACSGFVYGLSSAFAYASRPGVDNVLLLVGETFSKIVSPLDKVNAPLYGDAGTATLVRKGDSFGPSSFVLGSDGSGSNSLLIPAGGYRRPSTAEDLLPVEQEEGNVRSAHQIYMDAMEVFNFSLREVANNVKELSAFSGAELDSVDYLVFHQANKFMTDFIAKRLKFPLSKVPYCLDRYGNTSSCSIPLTICSELSALPRRPSTRVVLSGFGAGLSWGSCLLELIDCDILPVAEKT